MAERILVTGGAGFLGINLVRWLLERGYAVRSLDIAPFTYPEAGQIDAILGDIPSRARSIAPPPCRWPRLRKSTRPMSTARG